MPTTLLERKEILADASRLAINDVVSTWNAAQGLSSPEFRSVMINSMQPIADPYAAAASNLGAAWYDESAPELPFRAKPSQLPPAERLFRSAEWAMSASGADALALLAEVVQGFILDSNRKTIKDNAAVETGGGWIRTASAGACRFCQMLVTRSQEVYASELAATRVGYAKSGRIRGNQVKDDEYHDNCKCLAIEVRPGKTHTPASYTESWADDYKTARELAGSGDIKAIMAAYRQMDKK